jgi:hypothetical protein
MLTKDKVVIMKQTPALDKSEGRSSRKIIKVHLELPNPQ